MAPASTTRAAPRAPARAEAEAPTAARSVRVRAEAEEPTAARSVRVRAEAEAPTAAQSAPAHAGAEAKVAAPFAAPGTSAAPPTRSAGQPRPAEVTRAVRIESADGREVQRRASWRGAGRLCAPRLTDNVRRGRRESTDERGSRTARSRATAPEDESGDVRRIAPSDEFRCGTVVAGATTDGRP